MHVYPRRSLANPDYTQRSFNHLKTTMKLRLIISAALFLTLTSAQVGAAPDKLQVATKFAVKLGNDGPEGVAYDADTGHFYFVAESTIYQTDQKGGIKKRIGLEDKVRFRGIARTAKGQFLALAASSSEIHLIDSEGKLLKRIKLPKSPSYRAVSCSEDGKTIYVSDRSRIVVLDADGKKTKVINIPNGDIQGIAATSDGGLWMVDDETLVVTLLDKAGKKAHEISLKGLTDHIDPEGLSLDPEGGILYVCFDRSSGLIGIDLSKLD